MPRTWCDGWRRRSTAARQGAQGRAILIVGLAYKKNVDDMRESPSFKLIELLEARALSCDVHDPLVPVVPRTREQPAAFAGRKSVPLDGPRLPPSMWC